MGGAIRAEVEAGRTVIVELLTCGEADSTRAKLADGATHSWHPGRHTYRLSRKDLGEARLREFLEATARLGVSGVLVSRFPDGKLTAAQVRRRIAFWVGRRDEGLSLAGTAASDPMSWDSGPHPDHAAVWKALIGCGFPGVRGYLVYEFASRAGSYHTAIDISAWRKRKNAALAAYKKWDPVRGRYACGYHSVPEFFDGVGKDRHEYVVVDRA